MWELLDCVVAVFCSLNVLLCLCRWSWICLVVHEGLFFHLILFFNSRKILCGWWFAVLFTSKCYLLIFGFAFVRVWICGFSAFIGKDGNEPVLRSDRDEGFWLSHVEGKNRKQIPKNAVSPRSLVGLFLNTSEVRVKIVGQKVWSPRKCFEYKQEIS